MAEDNSFFVTVGMRHLKFWALDTALQQAAAKGEGKAPAMRKAVALEGKYVVFGKVRIDNNKEAYVETLALCLTLTRIPLYRRAKTQPIRTLWTLAARRTAPHMRSLRAASSLPSRRH